MKAKKRISLILALVMLLSCCLCVPALAANVTDFTDVPADAWYRDYLAYATENGMINGTSATTFSPSDTMTRGMFIAILGRAFSDGTETGTKFTDVPENQYYYHYVYWGVKYGVTYGTSETTFEPDKKISRQQMATMVGRAIKSMGLNMTKKNDSNYSFSDANQIDDYAKEGIQTCWEYGLMLGDTNGTFRPQSNVTRAEGTAVLVRFVQGIIWPDVPDIDPIPTPEPTPTPDPEPVSPEHTHTFVVVDKKDSTMNEGGYIKYSCDCGKTITTTYDPWNVEWYPQYQTMTHTGEVVDLAAARQYAKDYIQSLGFVVTNCVDQEMETFWAKSAWRLNGTKCDPNYSDKEFFDLLFGPEFGEGFWGTTEDQKRVVKTIIDKFYNSVITTGVEITDDQGTRVTKNPNEIAVGYYIQRFHVHYAMYRSARTVSE